MTQHKPTHEQAAIIDAIADRMFGSIDVDALAGAAKSTTLKMAAPHVTGRCMALAFNRTIKETLQAELPPHFEVLTMNGLGHRAWQRMVSSAKLKLDGDKLYKLIRQTLEANGFSYADEGYQDMREALTAIVSAARSMGLVPNGNYVVHAKSFIPDTPEGWFELADQFDLPITLDTYESWTNLARQVLTESIKMAFAGQIDFADQIYMPCCFGATFAKFDTVFVDEAQDLSPLNHYMVRKVCSNRVVAVGDERQSIYAFRGADPDSISKLRSTFNTNTLSLTTTFRCAKSIVRNVHWRAPHMKPADWAVEGEVLHEENRDWDISRLRPGVMVICRNNAPLISTAFKLLASGTPVTMIGGEITKAICGFIRKIAGGNLELPAAQFFDNLDLWVQNEIEEAQARSTPRRAERATDKAEVCRALPGKNPGELIKAIEKIFEQKNGLITLCSSHKSKGLEAEHIVHLSPQLIPSRFAESEKAILQENNLKYVTDTRAKLSVTYLNYDRLEA